jgi:hypothetical protein
LTDTLDLLAARCHGSCNHTLEDMAQYLALSEAAKPIHRECRMLWNFIL